MKVLGALATVHFVSRAGGFAQTFLVLYLTQDRHLSATTAGTVASAVAFGLIGSLLAGGWLSDRIGRRRTMVIGFAGTAVGLLVLGSAETMPAIWASAVFVGLMADLFRPAGSAMVADLPSQRERIRSFGALFWASNLGFSVSTVLGGELVRHGYGLLFWLNAAASVLAALIVWRTLPASRPSAPAASDRPRLRSALADRGLIVLALLVMAHFALFSQAFSTLPLAMAADGLGAATYGTVLAVNGIAILALQPLAVRLLADKDRYAVLGASMLLVGIGLGMGAFVDDRIGYGASVLVWTVGEIGVAVMFGATFSDLARADLRGGYLGIAYTAWGIGTALGPLIGTALLDRVGATPLWLGCALTGLALFTIQRTVAPSLRRRTNERVLAS